MRNRTYHTLTDHIAEQIRRGMVEGHWRETLPGRDRLAQELGCSHSTVEEALQRLTKKGLLVSQGPGRRRKIQVTEGVTRRRSLRIAILLYEPSDRKTDYLVELVRQLQKAGHNAAFLEKTMHDFGMNVNRIARHVSTAEADAWVVIAGPRDVLEWFSRLSTPTFALFGRFRQVNLPGTGPMKNNAIIELVHRLVKWGHRRIVNIVRQDHRKPLPGTLDHLFLDELEKHGIQTGAYNLPDWHDSPSGLQRLLDMLFQHTPPTALLLDEPSMFIAARDHLARNGIVAPRDVSLVCFDHDQIFDWCIPVITHIAWEPKPLIRRVVKWADHISRGKDDRRVSGIDAKLVLGGTIGPVPACSK